ncbi:MAG: hypothetical protein WCK11_04790 [Candidatus Falkowbacteria bacterium]
MFINETDFDYAVNNSFVYGYGNVGTSGEVYDLATRLENSSDKDCCKYTTWKRKGAYYINSNFCGKFILNYGSNIYAP